MGLLVDNFISYPWHSWREAIEHYKKTYPDLDWEEFINDLADLDEDALPESTYSEIMEAFAESGKIQNDDPELDLVL